MWIVKILNDYFYRSSMPALYPLFYNNLQDNIPSVRQGAALALANVAQVYGNFKKQFYQTRTVSMYRIQQQ